MVKVGFKMSKGIIGIFKCEEKGTQLCSVSVRSSETPEELEKAVQSEHHSVNLKLVGTFSFECNGETGEVEKKLRALLAEAFGKYVPPYKKWECYKVDYKKVISFIGSVLPLCKAITDFNE